jgi:uncharacterized OB-fold protein
MPIYDRELLDRFPDTLIDHDNKEFYRGWLERRLLVDRCGDCGNWFLPPSAWCPRCWSRNVTPTEVSGELAEQPGLRFTSTIVGCADDEMHIGMPVRLTWIDRYGEPYPVFEPVSA